MKKITIVALLVMLSVIFIGSANAASTISTATGATMTSTVFGGGVFAPSTGVTVQVLSTTSEYCAGSQHSSSTPTNKGLQFHTLYSSPEQPANLAITNGPTACSSANTLPSGMSPAP
jgi:hypothetical protein